MLNDTKEKLAPVTVVLHWLVAVLMIGLMAVGIYMEETDAYHLFGLHKSVGVIAFVFILLRTVWRISNGWLQPVSEYKLWEQRLSKVVHWLLMVGMVLFPISGMLMSGAGGYGVSVFGLELIAMNPDPADPQKVVAINADLAEVGAAVHGILAKLFIVLIGLHIVGAYKHHFVDKDRTMLRILGR